MAQDERGVTFAPRLTKQDGLIDWNEPASAVHNRVRGLHPWPHAYTFLGEARVRDPPHSGVSRSRSAGASHPVTMSHARSSPRGTWRSTHRRGGSGFRWVTIPAWLGGGNLADSAGRPPGAGDTRISGGHRIAPASTFRSSQDNDRSSSLGGVPRSASRERVPRGPATGARAHPRVAPRRA